MNGAAKKESPESVIMTRQENTRMPLMARKSTASIDPAIKSFIDNVIVAALVEQWFSSEGSKAA